MSFLLFLVEKLVFRCLHS